MLAASLVLAGIVAAPCALAAGLSPADRAIAEAERALHSEHVAAGAFVDLAAGFMRKSRESGDPAYYGRAAAALERALVLDPASYEARRARAWVLLGQHDFRGARAVAEAAQALRPDDWWNYGTLADAYVELGNYERAVAAAERMVALRPGLPSYTRVAWLRALYGDRSGAIRVLALAVGAGSERDPESLAWTLVNLGNEYFASGALADAASAYGRALALLPDYALALGGLGRVRAAEGRYREAIDLYDRAVARVPAPEVIAALGDVHAAAGDAAQAERQYALVEYIGRVAEAAGTTYGRQLALFNADHDRQLDQALRLAEREATGRGDIYTDDALAWALYKNRRFAEAERASQRARRLGTDDAMLYYHAGMIAAARGRTTSAARYLRRALALNPHFDLRQAEVARIALANLRAAGVATDTSR